MDRDFPCELRHFAKWRSRFEFIDRSLMTHQNETFLREYGQVGPKRGEYALPAP